jgi:hypothetical protein
MNQIKKVWAVALLALLPLTLQAQQHIKKAFDELIQDTSAELHAHHKLDKDPDTGVKESQLDWWEFTLPKSKQQLVKNIQRAFEQDHEQAYSINTGSNSRGGEGVESLAVGNSNSGGYSVGEIKGSDYIYGLFLDPEDTERIHRYAYVLEWKDKGDEILGRLAITYATTQKYRKGNRNTLTQRIIVNGTAYEGHDFNVQGSFVPLDNSNWLAMFNMYAKKFRNNPNSTSSSYYANYINELCKKPEANKLTVEEKKIVIEELGKLANLTDDEFTKAIFLNAMKQIK